MPLLLALTLLLALASPPAQAGERAEPVPPDQTQEWQDAQRLAREGVDKLLRSFDTLLQTLPYGLPRQDENGNIIIPRQTPHPLPPGGSSGPIRT